jgi:osmotically-inducible protein OsmY
MSSDKELQRRVMTECGRQENIAIAHIGIAAREGLVTLTGHVPSNAERQATATAAGRVKGVKVVINQISINPAGRSRTVDEELAVRLHTGIAGRLGSVPERIHLGLEGGVVILSGEVDSLHQQQQVDAYAREVDGIGEIRNEIIVTPLVEAVVLTGKINQALGASASIEIATEGGQVTLTGPAVTWHEKGLVESAVRSVPGVTSVTNKLPVR